MPLIETLMQSVPSAVNTAIGTGMGLITANWQDKRQLRQQQALNDQQVQANAQMAKINQGLALDTWKKTGYEAQVKQMQDAGLNIGLMYKQGGSGGTTNFGGGNVTAPHAPSGGGEIGMGLQLAMQNAQTMANIELMKANARKAEAEANKIGGVDTKEAETRIGKIIQETTNEELKGKLIQLETDIADIEKAYKPSVLEAEISNTIANATKLKLENSITQEAYDSIVNEIESRAIGQTLNNELTKAKTSLTNTEKQSIITGITQKWTELGIQNRNLDETQKRNNISKFEAEIQAEYPNAWMVIGSVLKKAYNSLENIETAIRGKAQYKDRVK